MPDTEIDIESWEESMYADGKITASQLRALRDAIKWSTDALLEKFQHEGKRGAGALLVALHNTFGANYNATAKILQLADTELSLGDHALLLGVLDANITLLQAARDSFAGRKVDRVVESIEGIMADGKVTAEEVDRIWTDADTNGDGKLSGPEVRAFADMIARTGKARGLSLTADDLEWAWLFQDWDHDQAFSRAEMRRALDLLAAKQDAGDEP